VLPLALDDCTFSSDAPILLQDAHLSLLSFQGSTVPRGIDADRCIVRGNVFLRNGASITGEVCFLGAKIDGNLTTNKSTLNNENGNALSCDGARIRGNVDLRNVHKITGQFCLTGTTIDGYIMASGSTLQNENGDALSCDRAWIGGNVDLRDDASITGRVNLVGATIGGYILVSGSTLRNRNFNTLSCDGARVAGNLDISGETQITGTVRLLGARIEGDVDAANSTLTAEAGTALNAEHAMIDGRVFLSAGFTSQGTISLLGATIRRGLDLHSSTIEQSNGSALNLRDIRVEGRLRLDSVRDGKTVPGRIDGGIDLRGANVAYFADRLADTEPENASGAIHLDQFRYERFVENSTLDVGPRLRWLRFQPRQHLRKDFRPQPFEQLATVYREMGHENDRHRVLLERHKHELRRPREIRFLRDEKPCPIPWWFNPLLWLKWVFFEGLAGYGHRVLPMFAIFFVLLGASVSAFWWASDAGHMVPADSRILALNEIAKKTEVFTASCDAPWTHCNSLILDEYPDFNAFVYSADVLLPIVGFEQQTMWTPNHLALDVLKWINILYGWFTGLMLVAIVSGVVQRA